MRAVSGDRDDSLHGSGQETGRHTPRICDSESLIIEPRLIFITMLKPIRD